MAGAWATSSRAGADVPAAHDASGVRGCRTKQAVRPLARIAGTGRGGSRPRYRGGSWDCPFVLLHTRMAPGDFPGRLGHRDAPRREQDDGWRADQRAGALPALSMLTSIYIGAVTLPRKPLGLCGVTSSRGPGSRAASCTCTADRGDGPCSPTEPFVLSVAQLFRAVV